MVNVLINDNKFSISLNKASLSKDSNNNSFFKTSMVFLTNVDTPVVSFCKSNSPDNNNCTNSKGLFNSSESISIFFTILLINSIKCAPKKDDRSGILNGNDPFDSSESSVLVMVSSLLSTFLLLKLLKICTTFLVISLFIIFVSL